MGDVSRCAEDGAGKDCREMVISVGVQGGDGASKGFGRG